MENEIIHKELDLVQGVINRMANNSFLLKGWLITLITVILVISKDSLLSSHLDYLSLILCLPVIAFWYLDAFFLHKEKCYRKLYEWITINRKQSDEFLYSLDYRRFNSEVPNTFKTMFTSTLIPFYGLTLLILIIITIYNLVQ